MRLFEFTTKYDDPDVEIGLMTKEEFIQYRNPTGKFHPDDAYDASLGYLNFDYTARSRKINLVRSFNGVDALEVVTTDKGIILKTNDKPTAVMVGDTLHYTIQFPVSIIPLRYPDVHIEPKSVKKVKYIEDVLPLVSTVVERNLKEFPAILQQTKIAGKEFTIRTTKSPYGKNSGETIAIFNADGLRVASAQNEWGTTLLMVAKEYRGLQLGKLLGKFWYERNPKFESGGFTHSGVKNAIKVWEDRVRTLLRNGWYSKLVKDGKITVEKVKEIRSQVEKEKKVPEPKKEKPELLVYADDYSFIVYDKKFFEEQNEKFIYAFGFLREHVGKIFPYRLEYDKGYRKIASYLILQIARDNGDKLFIEELPSDFVEFDDLPHITIQDNYASLDKDMIDLKAASSLETRYRKIKDQYDEIYHSLQELANSKWD